MSIFICPKCKFEIKTSRIKHVSSCNGEGPRRKRPKGKGRNWLKGLTLPKSQKQKIRNKLHQKYQNGEYFGIVKWMKENTELHKKSAGKGGGLKKGSGKGLKGWYKGFWCDSSWELAFVIYHLELGNKIERNKKSFPYLFNGKIYKYYPDFILNEEYIEIKGYESEKSKAKKIQFPHKLNTFYANEMKPILEYVISKYGKDFIKLYKELS
ncbi:MAG: hypothetical protein PHF86_01310 [Candidatus Nanoarchaeia archaeon]|nr:hypothetical protein [Candidatus Nanoarchaeia archaeon]